MAKATGVTPVGIINQFATICTMEELLRVINREIWRVSDPRGISDSYEDWLQRVKAEVEAVMA
jgi:hypothetical protein